MDCRQRTFRNLLRAAEVISCSSLLFLLLEPLRTAAGTSVPTPMQRRSSRRILPSVRVRQTLRKQVNQNYDGEKRIRLFSFPPFQLRQLFSCEKIEGVARSLMAHRKSPSEEKYERKQKLSLSLSSRPPALNHPTKRLRCCSSAPACAARRESRGTEP